MGSYQTSLNLYVSQLSHGPQTSWDFGLSCNADNADVSFRFLKGTL
jgi:hypothetical protein